MYAMVSIIKHTNKEDFKGRTCSSRSVHLPCLRKNGSLAARNLLALPVTKGRHPPGSSFFHSNIRSPLICQTPGQGRVQKAKNLFNSQDLTKEKKEKKGHFSIARSNSVVYVVEHWMCAQVLASGNVAQNLSIISDSQQGANLPF